MNPDTKLVLDELSKLGKRFDEVESKWDSRFEEHETKWETRFAERDDMWERKFADLTVVNDARVSALERAAASIDNWRPDIKGTVDTVRLEVGKLSKHWERSVLDRNAPILETVNTAASAHLLRAKPSGHMGTASNKFHGRMFTVLLRPYNIPRPRVRLNF